MEGRIWEIGKFWVWNGRMTGWWMIRVVMMTLGKWDDCGEEMNQEEADLDVADEVSEEVDRGLHAHLFPPKMWIFFCQKCTCLLFTFDRKKFTVSGERGGRAGPWSPLCATVYSRINYFTSLSLSSSVVLIWSASSSLDNSLSYNHRAIAIRNDDLSWNTFHLHRLIAYILNVITAIGAIFITCTFSL